jgi:hypothetical protein
MTFLGKKNEKRKLKGKSGFEYPYELLVTGAPIPSTAGNFILVCWFVDGNAKIVRAGHGDDIRREVAELHAAAEKDGATNIGVHPNSHDPDDRQYEVDDLLRRRDELIRPPSAG